MAKTQRRLGRGGLIGIVALIICTWTGVCGTPATATAAASAAPTFSATGFCVKGQPAFAITFAGLPPGGETLISLGLFDSPLFSAGPVTAQVSSSAPTVIWDLGPDPLFGPGPHEINASIGSSALVATNLNAVPSWPVAGSYEITLAPCGATASSFVSLLPTPDHGGYWQATSDGQVLGYGDARTNGSMSGVTLNRPIVGMASTPDGQGYWLVASDGGVFSFGDARFYGSVGGVKLNQPIVGMASTSDGLGYYLVAADGGVFTFGDAVFQGSMGAVRLNRPVVGMALDRATNGYWLVASDGGVFSFNSPFLGSTGSLRLNRPIVAMESQSGDGYRLVASDGGVFTFGSSAFEGSLGSNPPSQPVTSAAPSADGAGYVMMTAGGSVYAFGDTPSFGSVSGAPLVDG